ncbi:MAG TPA: electron transfer flavoprotein subunit alpha/FixB family protein [Rubricoccaceae bacterium]|nr:electron transfer flavoprotein subunit alpha/FixB family protein [Rubricoccaceae bacterium]
MPTILSYVAVQNGKPTRSSLEALSRAREVARARGADLAAAVLAPDAAAHADELGRYGAATVYAVSDPIFRSHLNTPVLAGLEAVIARAQPEAVVFPSTEGVKDVLGALAVRTAAAVLPDVARFEVAGDGAVEALRPVMAAKFLARVRAEGKPVLVSVRAGSYEASEAPAEARVEAVPFAFDEGSLRQTLREVVSSAAGAVDLSDARVVVAAGRGVKDAEGKRLVEELAGVLGAAIGASRAVVESGMFPATAQIGQTGKVVSPDLYVGVGISGAIQHVAGMANSRVIVAVNQNPDAPIFDVATYGIVGDLYKVLPPLIEAIKQRKGTS